MLSMNYILTSILKDVDQNRRIEQNYITYKVRTGQNYSEVRFSDF